MILSFNYPRALVRKIPNSFANGLKMMAPDSPILVEKAKEQHLAYEEWIRSVVPRVFTLSAENALPDCCFVEDTAVVAGGRALLTRIGAPERRPEVHSIRSALLDLGFHSLGEVQDPGTLDGGDVLFTGQEFLVGLSTRTNLEGILQLKNFFEGKAEKYPVHSIKIQGGLHLKSLVTYADYDTFVAARTPAGQDAILQMESLLNRPLKKIWVPDETVANVLRIGSSLLIQDGFPKSEKIIRSALPLLQVKALPMSEIIKADGALTCCSILVE